MFQPLGKMYLIRSAFEQYVYINIFLLCSFEGNLFDKDKKKKKVHELINITLTIDKSNYHSFAAPITLECKKGGIKFALVLLRFRIFNCVVLKNVQSKGSYVVADYY